MKIALRILIPVLILGMGWVSMNALGEKKEEPVKKQRDRTRNLPRVRAVEVRQSDFAVTITSNGIVRAHNSTSLTPRVSGRIQRIHERFEIGAFFKAGEVLAELDPTDFDAAVATAEARVARAEAALAQEEARALQAELDWKDLGYEDEKPSPLVLREPQLKEAHANLAAAQADLLSAQRDRERCEILAPYDGCVLERTAGLGQSVSPGTPLGNIFSTDFAEIRLPLSAGALGFFQLPEDAPDGAIDATLFDALDSRSGHSWNATVVRTEGVLNETSRELFVVARVQDPYGLESDHPPLRIGQPVKAQLEGRVLDDVIVLPREGLRSPTEIVLVNPADSTIKRVQIDPLWEEPEHVVVRDELPEGWLLVVSQLSYAADGAEVQIVDETESGELNAGAPGEPTSGKKAPPQGAPRG